MPWPYRSELRVREIQKSFGTRRFYLFIYFLPVLLPFKSIVELIVVHANTRSTFNPALAFWLVLQKAQRALHGNSLPAPRLLPSLCNLARVDDRFHLDSVCAAASC